jgi:hypothetical protein
MEDLISIEEHLKEEHLKEEHLKKLNCFLYYTVNKENNNTQRKWTTYLRLYRATYNGKSSQNL